MYINSEVMCQVASKILGTPVVDTSYNATELKGGTIGDVQLIGNRIPRRKSLPHKMPATSL